MQSALQGIKQRNKQDINDEVKSERGGETTINTHIYNDKSKHVYKNAYICILYQHDTQIVWIMQIRGSSYVGLEVTNIP